MQTIVHVSEVNITPQSGMGRVEYYWKKAFENSGYNFVHIGPNEIGSIIHKSLFPLRAYQYYKKLSLHPVGFIIHEPASGIFVNNKIPCFVESHGIERRYWEEQVHNSNKYSEYESISLRSKLLFPLWRLRGADKGLSKGTKLLLINSEDKLFVEKRYSRSSEDIFIFKNGISIKEYKKRLPAKFQVLFNGSWIYRKGIHVLVKAAEILYSNSLKIEYMLIGTGKSEEEVLSSWPDYLRSSVRIVSRFTENEEVGFLENASLFVLPSYSEGQPLSLLQAMAVGRCCITTNCCGQKDIIQNNSNGLLFELGNYQELANLVAYCYHNENFSKQIGSNAESFVQAFTWEKVSNEVVQFVLKNIKSLKQNA